MKSIVFTGGGSAGHIMPNLAIIDEIKNKYKINSSVPDKLSESNKNLKNTS